MGTRGLPDRTIHNTQQRTRGTRTLTITARRVPAFEEAMPLLSGSLSLSRTSILGPTQGSCWPGHPRHRPHNRTHPMVSCVALTVVITPQFLIGGIVRIDAKFYRYFFESAPHKNPIGYNGSLSRNDSQEAAVHALRQAGQAHAVRERRQEAQRPSAQEEAFSGGGRWCHLGPEEPSGTHREAKAKRSREGTVPASWRSCLDGQRTSKCTCKCTEERDEQDRCKAQI